MARIFEDSLEDEQPKKTPDSSTENNEPTHENCCSVEEELHKVLNGNDNKKSDKKDNTSSKINNGQVSILLDTSVDHSKDSHNGCKNIWFNLLKKSIKLFFGLCIICLLFGFYFAVSYYVGSMQTRKM